MARTFVPVSLFLAIPLLACSSIPGAGALWSKPDLRFLLVGETHGSVETPAIFGDLVCASRESQRPIVVGLERSTEEQPAIDAFLGAENHQAAVQSLLSHRGWHSFDGRSSRAMLALLETLRELKLEVVAFDASLAGDTDVQRDQRMASALMAAARRHKNALVIALTGNVHGSKKPNAELGNYPVMAMLLPPKETLTLLVTDKGGETWADVDNRCGPQKWPSTGGLSRDVDLSPGRAPIGSYDGVLSTGLPSTASPPALADAPPVPACGR